MLKILIFSLFILHSVIIYSQVETKEEEENIVVEEVIINNPNSILKYNFFEFLDSETSKFNKESAFKNLPWEIKDIYNFLKDQNDIIYIVEKFNLRKNIIEANTLQLGFKMVFENKVIESKLYNYSINKYIKGYGLEYVKETSTNKFPKLKLIERKELQLKEESTNKFLKFMPFMSLGLFRVLDEKETIMINSNEYQCTQVEGFEVDGLAIMSRWKYWMVTKKPGLIVKAIMESESHRYTWLLKEVK